MLHVAQNLGLRETAIKANISPTYLSRIERGKDYPPRPEVIKELTHALAVVAYLDVIFKLSSFIDPEIVTYLHNQPAVMNLLRYIKEADLSKSNIEQLVGGAQALSAEKQTAFCGSG